MPSGICHGPRCRLNNCVDDFTERGVQLRWTSCYNGVGLDERNCFLQDVAVYVLFLADGVRDGRKRD